MQEFLLDNLYSFCQMANIADARREMTKTKEQLEEEKKISLSIRIKPLDLDGRFHCNSK